MYLVIMNIRIQSTEPRNDFYEGNKLFLIYFKLEHKLLKARNYTEFIINTVY